jgi:hypothetical protein
VLVVGGKLQWIGTSRGVRLQDNDSRSPSDRVAGAPWFDRVAGAEALSGRQPSPPAPAFSPRRWRREGECGGSSSPKATSGEAPPHDKCAKCRRDGFIPRQDHFSTRPGGTLLKHSAEATFWHARTRRTHPSTVHPNRAAEQQEDMSPGEGGTARERQSMKRVRSKVDPCNNCR